jgi:hypothetical protein
MIPTGRKGRIVRGEHEGWYLTVEDDASNTGGYLILTSPKEDFEQGFDSWVENKETLEKYFQESNWKIEWLD